MAEILHLWALAPAAAGVCCMAADRRRARVPELVASVLMLMAMGDLLRAQPALTPVAWAAVLIAAAMVLAAVRGRGARRWSPAAVPVAAGPAREAGRAAPTAVGVSEVPMAVNTAAGMVLMSALIMMMATHADMSPASSVSAMQGMHSDGGVLVAVVASMTIAYVVASCLAAARAHTRLDRAQFAAMAASTAIMALAAMA